jgi:hypothetical protein
MVPMNDVMKRLLFFLMKYNVTAHNYGNTDGKKKKDFAVRK